MISAIYFVSNIKTEILPRAHKLGYISVFTEKLKEEHRTVNWSFEGIFVMFKFLLFLQPFTRPVHQWSPHPELQEHCNCLKDPAMIHFHHQHYNFYKNHDSSLMMAEILNVNPLLRILTFQILVTEQTCKKWNILKYFSPFLHQTNSLWAGASES